LPEKCLPNAEKFLDFEKELALRGFRRILGPEFSKQFNRLGLKAPRPREGRELGYLYYANEYTVFVWTTWLLKEQAAREEDAGWILIAERDKVLYFSHPIHRTKNFLQNLLMQARIARWKVVHRPLCPECLHFMSIVRGQALKQRLWKCDRKESHAGGKNRFRSWDYKLPEEAVKYLKSIRKKREKRYTALRAEGKEPHQAMLNRNRWGKRGE
jgi:hypothetical protein